MGELFTFWSKHESRILAEILKFVNAESAPEVRKEVWKACKHRFTADFAEQQWWWQIKSICKSECEKWIVENVISTKQLNLLYSAGILNKEEVQYLIYKRENKSDTEIAFLTNKGLKTIRRLGRKVVDKAIRWLNDQPN